MNEINITKENEWYIITDVSTGVTTQWKSIEETEKNLKEALELYYKN